MENVLSVSEIKIRELQESDLDFLTDPNGFWGPVKRDPKYLKWFMNYRRQESLLLVACLDDQIVGYYLNPATPLKAGNKQINAYGGSLFVHPKYRSGKRLIFNTLVRELHREAKNRKNFVYGLPRKEHVRYYLGRIKAHPLKTIPRYVYVLNPAYLLKVFTRNEGLIQFLSSMFRFFEKLFSFGFRNRPAGMTVKEIYFFDKRFDNLWKKSERSHSIAFVRSSTYLNWRFTQDTSQSYVIFAAERNHEVLGYAVLKPPSPDFHSGAIFDLFDSKNKKVTSILISKAVDYFRNQKVNKIEMYISSDYYEARLKSAGFSKRKSEEENFLVKSYSSEVEESYLYDPKNWLITL